MLRCEEEKKMYVLELTGHGVQSWTGWDASGEQTLIPPGLFTATDTGPVPSLAPRLLSDPLLCPLPRRRWPGRHLSWESECRTGLRPPGVPCAQPRTRWVFLGLPSLPPASSGCWPPPALPRCPGASTGSPPASEFSTRSQSGHVTAGLMPTAPSTVAGPHRPARQHPAFAPQLYFSPLSPRTL